MKNPKNEEKKSKNDPEANLVIVEKQNKKHVIPKRWGLWVGPSWSVCEPDHSKMVWFICRAGRAYLGSCRLELLVCYFIIVSLIDLYVHLHTQYCFGL